MPVIDVSDVKLSDGDRNEVLRYLGYQGQTISSDLMDTFSGCMESVNGAAQPKVLYNIYDLRQDEEHLTPDPDGKYPAAVFPEELAFLSGKDIKAHLAGCTQAVLMAATIGLRQDMMTRQQSLMDPLRSVIIDSAGSVLVEAVCDTAEAVLRSRLSEQGLFLTSRFSPGYGDLPLDAQQKFSEVLEIRRIGISVSADFLMTPRKSVTAVLGIAHHPVKKNQRSCDSCNLKGACRFRRMGFFCSE